LQHGKRVCANGLVDARAARQTPRASIGPPSPPMIRG
jgi:hypothetical protein